MNADRVIADARAIQEYVSETYGAMSDFIPYGAPLLGDDTDSAILPGGLKSREFHLVVARFEPENSVEMIVRAYLLPTPRPIGRCAWSSRARPRPS